MKSVSWWIWKHIQAIIFWLFAVIYVHWFFIPDLTPFCFNGLMIIWYCHFLFLLILSAGFWSYRQYKKPSLLQLETKGLKFRGTTLIHRFKLFCALIFSVTGNPARIYWSANGESSIWELRGQLGSLRDCLAPDGSSLNTQGFLIILFTVFAYKTITHFTQGFSFCQPLFLPQLPFCLY